MEPIIDAHGHLGDILHPNGGALIDKLGVTMEPVFDPTAQSEARLHNYPLPLARLSYRLFPDSVTRAERARNATATLENFAASMDQAGISFGVCLPVPPYLVFEDLAAAVRRDPRIIAFTGVDYGDRDGGPGSFNDPTAKLAADVAAGARGLKIHPIIQKISLASAETRAAVESFAPHRLPVLFHCGISSYYLGADKAREEPRYGGIDYAEALVRDFPSVDFIAGHAGLFEVKKAMKQLSRFSNVWVDTSFQSVKRVRELIDAFGPERVLFASDWPYGNRPPAVQIVRNACSGDRGLERRILFENAAELMEIKG
ncbi:MAG: amidohydrolase [bacterium]|nr:amidohydrolase [bacterium]